LESPDKNKKKKNAREHFGRGLKSNWEAAIVKRGIRKEKLLYRTAIYYLRGDLHRENEGHRDKEVKEWGQM